MNAAGRLTLPAVTRRALGVEDEAQFAVEVIPEGVLLRPVVVLPKEDAWAYVPEHRELLRRAHADSREGRVRTMTEEDLADLAEA